jgi:YVTN family beta-propeller protein
VGGAEMKHIFLVVVLFCVSPLFAQTKSNQTPRFRVMAFYSTNIEPDHVQFAQDAVRFFSTIAVKDNFTFDSTTDWAQLNESNLKQYQLIIWLNESPVKPEQRHAFEEYARSGGAWLGFHGAGYNDQSTNWPWFVDFLGGSVFYINSWPPLPAQLTINDRQHPVVAHLPATYRSPDNEWYIWKPSPRLNPDVRILASADASNFPLGLKDILLQGDLPVVWTNTKYHMVYMNMGHGAKILDSPTQNELIENAILWLGSASGSTKVQPGSTTRSTKVQTSVPEPAGLRVSPRAVVVSPKTHKAYAVNSEAGTVTIVDGTARKTVKVGDIPATIAVNSNTGNVYVGNGGSGTVSVIDGTSDQVTATVKVGELPYVLAVNPSTNKVYISKTFSNTITVIDGATNTANILNADVQADAIAVNPVTNKVYLPSYQSTSVRTIDSTDDSIGSVPGAIHIWGIAINPATNRIYLANSEKGRIEVIDGTTNAVTPVNTGEFPCAVAIDEVANKIYVANYSSDSVTVIDGASNSVLATIKVGDHPQALAANSQTHRVYVANTHDNNVSVIDGTKNLVIATVKAGKSPYAVAIDEVNNKAYVANIARDLTVIDGK